MIRMILGMLIKRSSFRIELRCQRIMDFFDLKPRKDSISFIVGSLGLGFEVILLQYVGLGIQNGFMAIEIQFKMGKQHKSATHNKKLEVNKPEPSGQVHKPSSSAQRIVWYLNVIVAIIVTYFMLHRVATKAYSPIFLFEQARQSQLLESFSLFISFILLVHTFSGDWLDVVFNKTQNHIYKTHQNIIQNTILWSAIFMGCYLYKDGGVLAGTGIQVRLIDLFLIGRVLFSLSYFLGVIVGHPSFRSVGFGLSFGCVVIMLCEALGHSILNYFK